MYVSFYIKAPPPTHTPLKFGGETPVWAKSPGAEKPGKKRSGGETSRGDGFGVKHPGTNVTGALDCTISTWFP